MAAGSSAWGFVAVFIFMIGGGVEISQLPGYLTSEGGLAGGQATLVTGTVYGVGVLIASWFSVTLSAIWIIFELIFLTFAINSGSLFFVATIYGILLAGFVPLSALMPSMVERHEKGAALAILNTGGAAFIGTAVATALNSFVGYGGVVIAYSTLYVISAFLTSFIKSEADPGDERYSVEDAELSFGC